MLLTHTKPGVPELDFGQESPRRLGPIEVSARNRDVSDE